MLNSLSDKKHKTDVIVLSQFALENYGNRLQSHAIIKLLDDLGLSAVAAAPNEHFFKQLCKDSIKSLMPHTIWKKKQRYVLFRQFSKKHAPYRRMPAHQLTTILDEYRCIVIGSDQVWSPFFLANRNDPAQYFLGSFAKCRKIALSPSFGLPEIPIEMQDMYAEGLASFARLSTREEAGAAIIKRLCGIEAEILIDPTLAVDVSHWRKIANYQACPQNRYVLTYYLGDGAEDIQKAVSSFAIKHDLAIIDIVQGSVGYNSTGPAEFLALIDNAAYFVTDSFHGAAFGLLFHTPFCVTRRKDPYDRDMFSRLETLLSKTGCIDRVFNNSLGKLPGRTLPWESIQEHIDSEQKHLKTYLEEELQRCGLL